MSGECSMPEGIRRALAVKLQFAVAFSNLPVLDSIRLHGLGVISTHSQFWLRLNYEGFYVAFCGQSGPTSGLQLCKLGRRMNAALKRFSIKASKHVRVGPNNRFQNGGNA